MSSEDSKTHGQKAVPERRRPPPRNVGVSQTEKRVNKWSELLKSLESSTKMDSIKKHRDHLIEQLNELVTILSKKETSRFERIERFQTILADIEAEEQCISKHIDRMEKSNAVKRAFIKKNVGKKFKEIAQRIGNIRRTVTVFEVNEKANLEMLDEEIKNIQLNMDKLDNEIKEKNEKSKLFNLARQSSRLGRHRSALSAKEETSQQETTKDNKSEILLKDGHCYYFGEGVKKDIDKAIDRYEESAGLGNAEAAISLGNYYESGAYDKVDLDSAAFYYRQAADQKKPYALYKTAQFIEKGIHQCKSESEARDQMFIFYKSAVEYGSPEATLRLAQIYEHGEHGIKANKDEALKLYQDVAFDDVAMNSIGSILYERGEYKRAVELFRKAAEKGNATALNNLGTWYELGKGVEINVNKAYDLYEESARKSNAQAMSNIGYLCYKKGKTSKTPHQFEEAAHWFRCSISEDHTIRDSHYYLGIMHQNGDGIEQWYKSAYKYYKIAADYGHDIACEKLGDLSYSGYGCIRPDKTKAFQWYQLGADKGNTQCVNNMGIMVESGFDAFVPNIEKAAEFYEKAHACKNTDATFNLGLLYLNNPEFERTQDEAIKLINEAAVKGNIRAQNYLISVGFINNKSEFIQAESEIESENELEEEEREGELYITNFIEEDEKLIVHEHDEEDDISEENANEFRKTQSHVNHPQKISLGRLSDMSRKLSSVVTEDSKNKEEKENSKVEKR